MNWDAAWSGAESGSLTGAVMGLLPLALGHISPVSGSDTPNLLSLNVLLFADLAETTMAVVSSLVGEVLSKEDSPFGPQLAIRVPAEKLAALACLPGVQEIELTARRVTANDLSRAAIGVAFDSTTPSNYIGLTGTNIVVNINDTGVDSNYPGLANRVVVDE